MAKKEMIEEMAKVMCGNDCEECAKETAQWRGCSLKKAKAEECLIKKEAKLLYNAGYRKIPEGSVVLSKEEYELYDVVNYSSMSSADISKGLSDTKELCINRLKEISNVDLEQMLEMLSSVTDEIEYEDDKKLIEEVTTLIYERMVPINEM